VGLLTAPGGQGHRRGDQHDHEPATYRIDDAAMHRYGAAVASEGARISVRLGALEEDLA
jgi:hypothetical protein